jgi:NADH:ubiquinone oxidoreductase subunit 2 (subunit N)
VLFSLAGLPPLGGFFIKFCILLQLIKAKAFILTFVILFTSVFSCFYYLRVVKQLFFEAEFTALRQKYLILIQSANRGLGTLGLTGMRARFLPTLALYVLTTIFIIGFIFIFQLLYNYSFFIAISLLFIL